nr:unnamed protein product [Callosobruchus chinensis]
MYREAYPLFSLFSSSISAYHGVADPPLITTWMILLEERGHVWFPTSSSPKKRKISQSSSLDLGIILIPVSTDGNRAHNLNGSRNEFMICGSSLRRIPKDN